jgi:hypothetical protein
MVRPFVPLVLFAPALVVKSNVKLYGLKAVVGVPLMKISGLGSLLNENAIGVACATSMANRKTVAAQRASDPALRTALILLSPKQYELPRALFTHVLE